jgi:hypothetical protein
MSSPTNWTNINPTTFTTGATDPTLASARHAYGVQIYSLFTMIDTASGDIQAKLNEIQGRQSSISIGDMFEMQMQMNHLSQLSEMSGQVVSAINQTINGFAQKIK